MHEAMPTTPKYTNLANASAPIDKGLAEMSGAQLLDALEEAARGAKNGDPWISTWYEARRVEIRRLLLIRLAGQ